MTFRINSDYFHTHTQKKSVSVMEVQYGLCEVGTEFLYIIWKISRGYNVHDITTDTSCSAPRDSNQHSIWYLQRVSRIGFRSTARCELSYARCFSCELKHSTSAMVWAFTQLCLVSSHTESQCVRNVLCLARIAHFQYHCKGTYVIGKTIMKVL
jgi:hypothetical protein